LCQSQFGNHKFVIQLEKFKLLIPLLQAGGEVYGWGNNADGQIEAGKASSLVQPLKVSFREPIMFVSAGAWHSFAISGFLESRGNFILIEFQ
jgi:hypothetical protein